MAPQGTSLAESLASLEGLYGAPRQPTHVKDEREKLTRSGPRRRSAAEEGAAPIFQAFQNL
jgi:hypothetical protein